MGHSRFSPPRVVPIQGVRYVRTTFLVVEQWPDGQPKTLRVMRDGDTFESLGGPDAVFQLAYAPAEWSRGT